MLELRFRAWHKRKKEMISHDLLYRMDCCNEFPFLAVIKNMYKLEDDLDVEVMQYVGAKDKNGLEIYEGDIVKTKHDMFYTVKFDEKNCGFIFNIESRNWKRYRVTKATITRDEIEVVGNIYKNPELLGGQANG